MHGTQLYIMQFQPGFTINLDYKSRKSKKLYLQEPYCID